MTNTIPIQCLTIAGFDGSGGAGLQADLQTFAAFNCKGSSVLTALPVQNSQGVKKCYSIPAQCVHEQLETIFADKIPQAIKIGMLYSADIIEIVANFLAEYAMHIPIVLDPVMESSSGFPLLQPNAVTILKNRLIPLATLITPNLPEAFALIEKNDDYEALAQQLLQLGSQAVLLKGGHSAGNDSNDFYLHQNSEKQWLKSKRLVFKNTHGTGCVLSAAITANLGNGHNLPEACKLAKEYLIASRI